MKKSVSAYNAQEYTLQTPNHGSSLHYLTPLDEPLLFREVSFVMKSRGFRQLDTRLEAVFHLIPSLILEALDLSGHHY